MAEREVSQAARALFAAGLDQVRQLGGCGLFRCVDADNRDHRNIWGIRRSAAYWIQGCFRLHARQWRHVSRRAFFHKLFTAVITCASSPSGGDETRLRSSGLWCKLRARVTISLIS